MLLPCHCPIVAASQASMHKGLLSTVRFALCDPLRAQLHSYKLCNAAQVALTCLRAWYAVMFAISTRFSALDHPCPDVSMDSTVRLCYLARQWPAQPRLSAMPV